MAERFRIEGLRELERALMQLPRATGKNVLRRTLIKAATPIAKTAERTAVRLTGRLKRNIKVGTRLIRRQRSLFPKRSEVEVYAGSTALPHAHMVEFGSVNNTPKPFMRKAWDGGRMGAMLVIKRTLAMEIEKSAARLARRQAKGTAGRAGR